MSMVERGGDEARRLGRLAHASAGGATTVGITGAPGAGKSTLTSALVSTMRARGEQVAVLAVDPSSPYTGGAILGDRVRMGDHALDDGVFIRSMATRGHLGGLSLAVPEAVRVLDAVGFPIILIETVGVGQVEVEIAGEADTTVVVVNPGWGDAVQANKAGLMEIADVFVVNKADRAGLADTLADIERMLSLRSPSGWRPPVIATTATTGEGVEQFRDALADHAAWSIGAGVRAERRARRAEAELDRIVTATLRARVTALHDAGTWDAVVGEVRAQRLDPWSAAEDLLG
ncbi:MAG: methylmalonyl Co-A mutase-associated GTPase MeaB [Acidobacteria bacterium]|nr:methylmalonyl Co-A mutase-associated GTPase MeaB [Acidobacteriota bacterium]